MKERMTIYVSEEVKDFFSNHADSASKILSSLATEYMQTQRFREAHPEFAFVSLPVPLRLVNRLKGEIDTEKLAECLDKVLGTKPDKNPFTVGDRTYTFGKPIPAKKQGTSQSAELHVPGMPDFIDFENQN